MRFTGMSLWELYTFGPPAETIGAYVAADAPDAASTDVWTVMSTARTSGRHGPLRRRPLADVIFRDHWGTAPGTLARPANEGTGAAPHE
jgi:hypothetical protein